jgi:hypothetical protein
LDFSLKKYTKLLEQVESYFYAPLRGVQNEGTSLQASKLQSTVAEARVLSVARALVS